MDIKRETLEVDILVVGAGPGGLSFAYHLAQLVGSSGGEVSMPEVVVIEKGTYPGAHSFSGAILDPRAIRKLIPDFLEKGMPYEKKAGKDSLYFLTEGKQFRFPFLPAPFHNDGNYIISLNKFTAWLSEQAEAAQVNIFPGTGGFELLIEDGTVAGVRTVDLGFDKEGNPKDNAEPGSLLKAKVTILAEGVHGSLTKQAYEKLGIGREKIPQQYLTGVKEVWDIPAGRLSDGEIVHTFGWPQPHHEYGGGFIYDMGDNMAAIGYCAGLNSPNPTNDPHYKFQQFKRHPMVRRIFEGGKMLHYGAKTIPEGGLYAMPRMYHDGLLIIGDSAGFLNSMRLKGIHLAMESGMLAAETVFEALKKGDFTSDALKWFGSRFETSAARNELHRVRNFHSGFEDGLLVGLMSAGMQMITGGFGFVDRRQTQPDYAHMLKLNEYLITKGQDAVKKNMKFDNEYTFDKLTDVYRSGTKHEEDQPPHLLVADYDICNNTCTEEYGNPCQHFCPAQVYEMVDDESRPGKKRLQLTPSNCVHCKTCDIVDPYQIITWVVPEGGGGPIDTNC